MERRLAAVMFSDIVGYAGLMGESERRGLLARSQHREIVAPIIKLHNGEVLETKADEILSIFSTVLDAIRAALLIETELETSADFRLHISIHVGEIVVIGGEASGDAVNVASRICALSDYGGIRISAPAYDFVRNHSEFEAKSLGIFDLKNVPRPIEVYDLRKVPKDSPEDAIRALQHQWAKRLQLAEQVTNPLGMSFALVPPGVFMMGSSLHEITHLLQGTTDPQLHDRLRAELPRHEVEISAPFYLGLYPVTQREYRQLMGQNPSSFTTQEEEEHDWHPVVNVSWHDASAFCDRFAERSLWPVELDDWSRAASNAKKLTCHLPTEAQWEYACRGGAQGAFCFGNDESHLVHYAWFGRNAFGRTLRVGRLEPNSLGLHDMHGNVWEWCHDWYRRDYYARSPRRNPYGPATGMDRVLRGGAFQDDSSTCRAARRYADVPDFSGSNKYGFRVLIDLDAHDLQISTGREPLASPVAS